MNKGVIIAKRYEVVKLIGQGGMADVYLAFDILLERNVAIKILRNELSNDAVSLLRFKHEAVAVSKLSHANIIEIYDIGEYDSRQYIVMEYVDGKTLKDLIVERGGLYKEEVIYIMKQLVSAVAEAHRNQIIHRDIKPQNILVKSDGSVIITDFGIALAQNALHLTQKETVMGSVHYLAPELARGETATYQSDIYALGIVFYELLTGSVPFKGDTAIQIAMKHINEPMPSIREYNPSIPQSVENTIIKSTYKNKDLRYHSAEEMLEGLETVLSEDRLDETKLTEVIVPQEHAETKVIESIDHVKDKKKDKKKKQIIIAIVSVFLVLSAVGVYFLTRSPKLEEKEVPDIVGLKLEEAKEKLEKEGFEVGEIKYELDDLIDKDEIISQDPKKGEKLEEGSKVNLVISEGKYFVFGNYIGQDINVVRSTLESQHKNLIIRVEYVENATYQAGSIISQSVEEGTKLNPKTSSEVKFLVVKQVEFTIPASIYGMNIYEAQTMLESMGAIVRLEAITDGNGKIVQGDRKDYVEYTTPSKNSLYVYNGSSAIVIHYYAEEKTVEEPDPKPDDKKPEDPNKDDGDK